jgi:hypothetical protein
VNDFYMNEARRKIGFPNVYVALAALLFAQVASAETTRTQTISLHRGWNAVYLQVSPANYDPGTIFANTPFDIVATYFPVDKPVQYIQNPASTGWNKAGWAVWYAPTRADSFLSSLHAVHGNRAFLIFSKQDFTWTVNGAVALARIHWQNDSFNLRGFDIDETAPPTFDQYFGASAAHHPYRIYRLINGQWTLVVDPIGTQMNPGEAYWTYCHGGSDYQGPLRAGMPSGQGIDFGDGSDSVITFANNSTFPMNIRIETVSSDAGLPLAYTIRGVASGGIAPVSISLPSSYQLPVLEAGNSTSFWVKLRRENMINPVQSTLLKITTDDGVRLWVPVSGNGAAQTSAQ